ncbi:MAG TPA: PAS domain S-box protein [Anaerolineales bacterium]|nr:PAS domain S-box protein [Anaerolineales bacterium]
MEFQTNPYLIWQLIPGFILLAIGVYIRSRPIKKRVSSAFAAMMFAGSLWAFTNAIQLITPNVTWQRFWNSLTYLGVMVVPTSWFLLSVKLTGILRNQVEKLEKYLWIPPLVLYLFMPTSAFHNLFFTSFDTVVVGGYVTLENSYGILFYVHTGYSYFLILSGIGLLVYSLATKFKQYGVQAYGLIIGVLTPLAGNAYFLFGSPPAGFPDPTPIIFTVTGVAFAWAIFGGHILEVVPLAHEAIVRKLSTGVLILDEEKNIRDINNAAREMLGVTSRAYAGDSLTDLIEQNMDIALVVNEALDASIEGDKQIQVAFPSTRRTFDVHISHIGVGAEKTTGWLIQFNDISGEKLAEEHAIATQKTMKAVLDTLQDSFFEADPSGVITYANKSFITNLGFTNWEEVQGKHFRNFTDRKSVREMFEKFKLLYKTKKPLEPFEYLYRTKDGRSLVGETTVSPIMDGDNVIGSRGVIRNVTDRVNAEREVLKQKDTLDSLLAQSPIAMVINDKSNQITMLNPAFEKLFGYTREEVIGKHLEDFLPSLEFDTSRKPKSSNASVVKSTSYIRKRKAKDGRVLDVEIFNTPFHVGGERFGYLVFYNDITERLKTQSDLEQSKTSYFDMVETLEDGYFEVLRSGFFSYVNQALCDKNGFTREELLGKHFRIVASRKSIRDTVRKFEKMFETGDPIPQFDFIFRNKDGQELTSEMSVTPIIEDGNIVGGRGLIRDISVRVAAEDAIRQAKDAAEARAGELDAINRVAEKVGQSLDLEEILQAVCKELISIFEIRNAGIGLLTADKKNLEIVAFQSAESNEQSALGMILPVEGNSSSMEVVRHKKTVVIQDAQSDERTSSISDISRQRGTKSIMIVPLLARGEAIGTIGMPAKDPDHMFSEDEIQLAETIASQIASAVDNAQLHAKTESALGAAERDLEIGRQIQSGFFPETLPKLKGWEIATHFHAARQVAGDFYDVFKLKGSEFTAFIIADVCDKGVGAALFMVLFRSLLRAFSEKYIDKNNVRSQLLDIILSTNNFIAEYHGKSNMFATLFFGVLDPESGTLHYVNGGHEPPVILDKDGKVTQRLMPTGPAVGMFVDLDFNVEQVQFEEGDFLVGFTDGTTDAKSASGNQFTEGRLLKNVAHPWTSIFSMLFELNVELANHIGDQSQFDDITLIAFRRKSAADGGHHAICRRADLSHLSELREFVESAAVHSGLKPDDVFAFKLVVDELCANIIQYGFEGRESGMMSLAFDVEGEGARLIIRDDGAHFSPDQAQNPDLEADWDERQIGGLGIYFVKELMDNVSYNRTDDGVNQFVLEKKINKTE